MIALTGTGLSSIALALLAYDLAGGNTATVLGTALALKMVAYVGIAPILGGFAHRLPRRRLLIALAAAALAFVSYDGLFSANAAAFVASAFLVFSVSLPSPQPPE